MAKIAQSLIAVAGLLATLMLAPLAHAAGADRAHAGGDEAGKATAEVRAATEVLGEIMDNPDRGIPRALLKRAAAVAIFPGIIKAGFIVGGRYGRGVILRHDPDTHAWSAPAFYTIGGASVGWQIGAKATDLILIIRRQQGVDALLKQTLTLGSDVSVTAGPVGRVVHASNDVALKSGVLAYSRSRGLFAGVALEGARIDVLKDYNRAYYGRDVTARQILIGQMVTAPPASAGELIEALARYSR